MRHLHTLAWACYLGASWTWVIGMVLPILLLRDFGPWGWVVFAVPNVLGAMAFGFVLNERRSAALTANHPSACLCFSRVTMAYQVIVLPWALVMLLGWPLRAAVAASIGAYAAVIAATLMRPLAAAVLISVGSLALLAWFSFRGEAWVGVFTGHRVGPRLGRDDLLAFIPAATFGFALCPYLDLTFHHARQQSNRAAFAIGFGVVFLASIVLALAYSGLGAIALIDRFFPLDGGPIPWLLGAFMIVQSGFTVAAHLREVCRLEQSRPARVALPLLLFLLIGAFLVMRYPDPVEAFDMSVSHMVYRALLVLYGTIFPAYVLVAMIPTRRPAPRRRKLRIALFAGAMCAPMAFVASVEGHSAFVVGIFITLAVARVLASRGDG